MNYTFYFHMLESWVTNSNIRCEEKDGKGYHTLKQIESPTGHLPCFGVRTIL